MTGATPVYVTLPAQSVGVRVISVLMVVPAAECGGGSGGGSRGGCGGGDGAEGVNVGGSRVGGAGAGAVDAAAGAGAGAGANVTFRKRGRTCLR